MKDDSEPSTPAPVEQAAGPYSFERVRARARALVQDPEAVQRLLGQAQGRLERASPALRGVLDDLTTLLRLLAAWARGDYRQVPAGVLVAMVAAVLYFVMPFDALPDFIPALGLVDDVAVLTWVVARVRRDMDAFRAWERAQSDAVPAPDREEEQR